MPFINFFYDFSHFGDGLSVVDVISTAHSNPPFVSDQELCPRLSNLQILPKEQLLHSKKSNVKKHLCVDYLIQIVFLEEIGVLTQEDQMLFKFWAAMQVLSDPHRHLLLEQETVVLPQLVRKQHNPSQEQTI